MAVVWSYGAAAAMGQAPAPAKATKTVRPTPPDGKPAEKMEPAPIQVGPPPAPKTLEIDPAKPAAAPAVKPKPVAKLKPAAAPPREAGQPVPWLTGMEEAHRRALAERKPILVRVGAQWCRDCRRLAAEIEKPSVQEELERWMPVFLDFDSAEEEARELNVTVVPALRVRAASGELIASHDGAFSAEELVEWLKKHYEEANAEPDEVFWAAGAPETAVVARLIEQFSKRNPAIREAAVRRLAPWPAEARAAVTRAFGEGSLATRLSALELLRQWRAPVDDLDPWRPETLTPDRTAKLAKWAQQAPQAAPPLRAPSAADLAAAQRDMDRMLKASPNEAEAIGHRLATLGAALVPEVAARLKAATSDQDRQRLWTLRYRLVASDSLALRWPGGLARLGSTDARQRQQAADELARMSTAEERALLVELFSDPDPLVREISLRGLQNVGGKEATAALVKLLSDPEPNVRAAVLKQLEEKPDASMVPEVAGYLKREKDADLLVHGIRFLRTAGGREAIKTMMAMLQHESWQVRAEAAEALTKIERSARPSSPGESEASESLQADVFTAMLKLLDDPEPFVVSRALEGLQRADMSVAVEPLITAAVKHPEMASKILPILAQGSKMRTKGLPHLRKFTKHESPQVRAAALWGLHQAVPDGMAAELTDAIGDRDSKVRIAAASIVFAVLEKQRERAAEQKLRQRGTNFDELTLEGDVQIDTAVEVPAQVVAPPAESALSRTIRILAGGEPKKPVVVEKKPEPPKEKPAAKPEPTAKPKPDVPEDPWDRWLRECYAGKRRPAWTTALVGPLETMLQSKEPEEQLRAALALVPLGKAKAVLPVMDALVRSHPEQARVAMEALPWLVWEDRLQLFRQLRSRVSDAAVLGRLIDSLGQVPDRRAAAPLWEMLADPKLTQEQAVALERGLRIACLGQGRSRSSPGPTDQEVLDMAKVRTASGSELQRIVALTVLAAIASPQAIEVARSLDADPRLSAQLRRDAFQVVLVLESGKKAADTAIAALADKDTARRQLALAFLVHGRGALAVLRESFSIQGRGVSVEDDVSRASGTPIVPKPPTGVEARHVRPLLADPDPRIAAQAGYLLALLGEKDGLEPLLRQVRVEKRGDWAWQRLAVRAIAALDDSSRIAVLREIYQSMDRQQVSEFYWSIRVMTGPEILAFRKQIRDEVGMSNLR